MNRTQPNNKNLETAYHIATRVFLLQQDRIAVVCGRAEVVNRLAAQYSLASAERIAAQLRAN